MLFESFLFNSILTTLVVWLPLNPSYQNGTNIRFFGERVSRGISQLITTTVEKRKRYMQHKVTTTERKFTQALQVSNSSTTKTNDPSQTTLISYNFLYLGPVTFRLNLECQLPAFIT